MIWKLNLSENAKHLPLVWGGCVSLPNMNKWRVNHQGPCLKSSWKILKQKSWRIRLLISFSRKWVVVHTVMCFNRRIYQSVCTKRGNISFLGWDALLAQVHRYSNHWLLKRRLYRHRPHWVTSRQCKQGLFVVREAAENNRSVHNQYAF